VHHSHKAAAGRAPGPLLRFTVGGRFESAALVEVAAGGGRKRKMPKGGGDGSNSRKRKVPEGGGGVTLMRMVSLVSADSASQF
jgi:hypothetical protein